jgi:hypothetical protein
VGLHSRGDRGECAVVDGGIARYAVRVAWIDN